MSDTSGGPGWWVASDGKWYPPETHPDYGRASAPQRFQDAGADLDGDHYPAADHTATLRRAEHDEPGSDGFAAAWRERRGVRVGVTTGGLIALILILNAIASSGSSSSTSLLSGASAERTIPTLRTATTLHVSGTGTTLHATGSTAVAAKGGTTFTDVCSGRAATAVPAPSQSIDYTQAAQNLQFALDHAPSEIKADLTLLMTPLISYYQLLATAKGNYVVAAQSAQFQTIIQRFNQADWKAALDRVETWFATHCS